MATEPTTVEPAAPTEWPSLDLLEGTVKAVMDDLQIPGANVLISHPDRETWIGSFGVSDVKTGAPVTPDMHARIGSITKPMVSTIVLQLVKEGLVGLDDTLATVLPEYAWIPNSDTVTVCLLLNMRSGIWNFTETEGLFPNLVHEPDRIWTDNELVELIRGKEPYFAPGSDFHYTNTAYILLGLLIKNLTGDSVGEALQTRLFSPLGLTETSYPTGNTIATPHPRGYSLKPASKTDSGEEIPASAAPQDLIDATVISASVAGAAGAVVSTLTDLEKFIAGLMSGATITPELQAERDNFVFATKPDGTVANIGYGLWVANFGGLIGHNGGIPGFQSFATYHERSGATIVTLVNIEGSVSGKQPADAIGYALGNLLPAPSDA